MTEYKEVVNVLNALENIITNYKNNFIYINNNIININNITRINYEKIGGVFLMSEYIISVHFTSSDVYTFNYKNRVDNRDFEDIQNMQDVIKELFKLNN